jgi:triosephosphate isomerase
MRKPVIAANWKMHKTHHEAQLFIEGLRNRLQDRDYENVEIVVCPPFTSLRTVQTTIDGDDLEIALGAQDVHWEEQGAYTGEVSALMLEKLKVRFVIVGHSERREFFGETDQVVNKKVSAVISQGLTPIMCVGETKVERESGSTEERIGAQLEAGLSGLKAEQVSGMVIAYEPIWAIGTGLTASKEDAQETIAYIRASVKKRFKQAANELRIQYGGSVKPGNIAELMSQPDIDGALVGGASLDPEEFAMIVRYDSGKTK